MKRKRAKEEIFCNLSSSITTTREIITSSCGYRCFYKRGMGLLEREMILVQGCIRPVIWHWFQQNQVFLRFCNESTASCSPWHLLPIPLSSALLKDSLPSAPHALFGNCLLRVCAQAQPVTVFSVAVGELHRAVTVLHFLGDILQVL